MSIDFHHLGLTIAYDTDVREFYQDILGLDVRREFVLEKEMAERIFHLNRDVKIVAGMIGDMYMELFLDSEGSRVVWEHVCLVVGDRAALIEKCRAKDYDVTVIEREPVDMVFVCDRSGNRFEIKQY
ncbi:MAG: hypothetical protein JXR87_02690 [Candidatus Marinimicrobia bacterium]|nr:hypothetical protein [Candidatus Neomarinimicrobiota bacterium]